MTVEPPPQPPIRRVAPPMPPAPKSTVSARPRRATMIAAFTSLAAVGIIVIGVSVSMSLQRSEPDPVPPPTYSDPDAESQEPAPLDPGAGLPVPVISSMTRTELDVVMHQFLDDTLTAARIDDPEIPDDLVFPFSYAPCDATSVRASVEVWFHTADNPAALPLIEQYWQSLGYTVLTSETEVAAAGRTPLVMEKLSLATADWDDENLRLDLMSACVLDQ